MSRLTISAPKTKLFGILFGSVFLLMGLFAANHGLEIYREGEASKSWPHATGVVKHSRIAETVNKDRSGRRKTTATTYSADVLYEYDVESKKYLSSNIRLDGYGTSDPSDAQRIADRYPAGATVDVFYNPKDPYRALLEPGTGAGFIVITLIGLVFAAVGAYIVIAALKTDTEPKKEADLS